MVKAYWLQWLETRLVIRLKLCQRKMLLEAETTSQQTNKQPATNHRERGKMADNEVNFRIAHDGRPHTNKVNNKNYIYIKLNNIRNDYKFNNVNNQWHQHQQQFSRRAFSFCGQQRMHVYKTKENHATNQLQDKGKPGNKPTNTEWTRQ